MMAEQWKAAQEQVERFQQAQPYDRIEVECIAEGVYRLHSAYDCESVLTTGKALLDLLDWLYSNRAMLAKGEAN